MRDRRGFPHSAQVRALSRTFISSAGPAELAPDAFPLGLRKTYFTSAFPHSDCFTAKEAQRGRCFRHVQMGRG